MNSLSKEGTDGDESDTLDVNVVEGRGGKPTLDVGVGVEETEADAFRAL